MDGVTRLTIDRADARNALNDAAMLALTAAIRAAEATPGMRAIVVSGAGDKAFCAGADLKPGSKTFGFDYSVPSTVYADLLRTAASCTLPMIARVNGHCLAGGIGILAMCDIAVAVDTARFGLPAAELDAKVDWLLARLVDELPTAIRRGKYALRIMQDMTFEQAIGYAEVQIGSMVHTEDATEGLRAFNEKRSPAWTGR